VVRFSRFALPRRRHSCIDTRVRRPAYIFDKLSGRNQVSDRFGTFMFIPHENSNVRSFRTTRRTIVGSACIVFGVLALAAGAGAWFVSGGRPGAAPAIAQENERLRTEISTLQGKTDELGQRLEDLL